VNCRADNLSDTELALQSQAGSMAAFEELVRRYEHRIYGFALRCCGTEADAADIAQETFVKAFQGIARFDPVQNFRPWLFAIARHTIIDRHRVAGPAPAELPELIEADNPAEQLARADDQLEIWRLAGRRLPPEQFQALWLRYVEDLSVREIARVLRKTATHVKVLLFRARKTLARELCAPARRPGPIPARPLGLALPGPEQPL